MTATRTSKELSIVEARKRLTQLPEELGEDHQAGAVTVTRRGKPVLAVMSYELYDSIMETLEVLSDPELMPVLRESIREVQDNRLISWQKVKGESGL